MRARTSREVSGVDVKLEDVDQLVPEEALVDLADCSS